MHSGDILIVECTDPLAGIDIPNLLNQTGDTLEETTKEKRLLTFRIRKNEAGGQSLQIEPIALYLMKSA